MEPTRLPAPPSEQTWEASNISLVRWLLPLLGFLGLGWLAAHFPSGRSPWLSAIASMSFVAWRILGFVAAVQSVRFFFRSNGALPKLTIAVLSLAAFVLNWIYVGEVFHMGPD